MAFGRSRRLARTAAHTAVAAATVQAVTGSSARRQGAAAPAASQPPVQPPTPAGADPQKSLPSDDVISMIERLAALHASGALTDEEFSDLKARALS